MLSALTALALTMTLNLEQALTAPEIFQARDHSPLSLSTSLANITTDAPQILDVTDYFKHTSSHKLNHFNDWLKGQSKLALLGRTPSDSDFIYELDQHYPILCGTIPNDIVIFDDRGIRSWIEPQPVDPEFDYPLFEPDMDDEGTIHPLFDLDRDRPRYSFPNVC
jgi:hypothetical protein